MKIEEAVVASSAPAFGPDRVAASSNGAAASYTDALVRKQPLYPMTASRFIYLLTTSKHFGRAQAEPRGWPGIGRSEERPSFDGLCPAMTENDMEITD